MVVEVFALPTSLRRGWSQIARVIGRALDQVAAVGTTGYPLDTQRRLKILNMIAGLIAVTTGVYAIRLWNMDYETYKPIILINTSVFFMALLLPVLHRFGPIAAAVTLVIYEYAAIVALTACMGRDTGLHIQLLVPAAASFVVLGLERLRLILLIIAVGIALHILAWFSWPQEAALVRVDRWLIDEVYTQAAITTGALIAASVWYAFRLVEEARAETDALLRNVLPDYVVDRLKRRPSEPIADTFEDASVLFADISGFVPLARELGAPRVVVLLNQLVSEFDTLATRHRIEKIKTIGDAYMAAGGVPERSLDHLPRLVLMAHDMLDVVGRVRSASGLAVHMRIGIAAGPVMAGVIGRNKFSYDVWGDTVNLAARLESRGTPDRILVCPTCRERLDEEFLFESVGTIEMKGIGERETWFVAGRKGEGGAVRDNPPGPHANPSSIFNNRP